MNIIIINSIKVKQDKKEKFCVFVESPFNKAQIPNRLVQVHKIRKTVKIRACLNNKPI